MSNYVVTGACETLAPGGWGAARIGVATLTISDSGSNSGGFTFTRQTEPASDALTEITLNTLDSKFVINGSHIVTDFKVYIGSALWHSGQIQLLEFVNPSNGVKYFFQLQGGSGAEAVSTLSDWKSLLAASDFSGKSAYSEGDLIHTAQFASDAPPMDEKLNLTAGNDSIIALTGHDTIYGGDGNDTIKAGSGHDQLNGGNGNDIFILLTASPSTASAFLDADSIFGGTGTDELSFDLGELKSRTVINIDLKLGTAAVSGASHAPSTLQSIENVRISGANPAYNDITIIGSDGANVIDLSGSKFGSTRIYTGSGGDVITGLAGDSTIDGGSGNDIINMTGGSHHILGNTGNDRIINAGSGEMFADGGTGNDVIHGGSGTDKIIGSNGDDSLMGGSGNDSIYGGIGGDSMSGDAGNDLIYGSEGNDTIDGVSGQDTISGGSGDDLIFGGAGNLVAIYGSDGNDNIHSGGQSTPPPDLPEPTAGQTMFGGNGNDTLTGDWGQNIFDGGAGYDLMQGFVFDGSSKVADHARDIFILDGPDKKGHVGISETVTYFEHGIDKLDISDLDEVMRLSSGNFKNNGEAQMHFNAWSAMLEADLDGDGKADWTAEVYTVGHAQLTNSDFIF